MSLALKLDLEFAFCWECSHFTPSYIYSKIVSIACTFTEHKHCMHLYLYFRAQYWPLRNCQQCAKVDTLEQKPLNRKLILVTCRGTHVYDLLLIFQINLYSSRKVALIHTISIVRYELDDCQLICISYLIRYATNSPVLPNTCFTLNSQYIT